MDAANGIELVDGCVAFVEALGCSVDVAEEQPIKMTTKIPMTGNTGRSRMLVVLLPAAVEQGQPCLILWWLYPRSDLNRPLLRSVA